MFYRFAPREHLAAECAIFPDLQLGPPRVQHNLLEAAMDVVQQPLPQRQVLLLSRVVRAFRLLARVREDFKGFDSGTHVAV